MKKHRILIPTDGSDFGRQIIPYVEEFLPPEFNEIVLLHVCDDPQGRVGHPGRPAAVDSDVEMYDSRTDYTEVQHPIYASQERESALAEIRLALQDDTRMLQEAGYTVVTDIRFGHKGEEIVHAITAHEANLVAMTTHWRTGISKLIFGNVVEYVARHLSIPIIMVRPRESAEVEAQNGQESMKERTPVEKEAA